MASLKRDSNNKTSSFQWMDLYKELVASRDNVEQISNQRLQEIGIRYAQDPAIDYDTNTVQHSFKFIFNDYLRLQPPADPLKLVARSWEESLSTRASFEAELISTELLHLINKKLLSLRVAHQANDVQVGQESNAQIFHDSYHLQNAYIDIPPFCYLSEKFRPNSVLDLGAGNGAYAKLVGGKHAHKISAFDGIGAHSSLLNQGSYFQVDFGSADSITIITKIIESALPAGKHELGMCLEVLEHLHESAAIKIHEILCRYSQSIIVFSAAGLGQPGIGHINCRPLEYWLSRFIEKGWSPCLKNTLAIRSLSQFSWLRRNLLVLKPRLDKSSDLTGKEREAIIKLVHISRKPFKWYRDMPSIVKYPYASEACPDLGGYQGVDINSLRG
jgi:hypothetical protein